MMRNFLTRLKKFFREDLSEIIGAYFDGEKIFIARLTEKFETVEVDADSFEIERLAEQISIVCNQKGWKTSLVGFCLREEETVTYLFEVSNVPEKEFPALVKSWAIAQAGKDAPFSFVKVDGELWMETLPRTKLEEICAANRLILWSSAMLSSIFFFKASSSPSSSIEIFAASSLFKAVR